MIGKDGKQAVVKHGDTLRETRRVNIIKIRIEERKEGEKQEKNKTARRN